jgi:hypothetical protein
MRKYCILTISLSQWPYTALSEIRPSVLTSIIGVVSFVVKETTQTQRGGTSFPCDSIRHSCHTSQIGAFAFLYWIPLSWIRLVAFFT